jgi:DNA-binding LacI/PurR family transcriptional regulator
MITIKDVAHKANVSVTTASLVLNQKDNAQRISTKTRDHVLQVAASLGYVPNLSARQLRQQTEHTLSIALLLPHDSRVSIMGEIVSGIQRFLLLKESTTKCSLTVEMYNANEFTAVNGLQEPIRFNGAILANLTEQDELYLHEHPIPLPCVLLQRNSDLYDYADGDNIQAGKDVAKHFISNGHHSIVLLVPRLSSDAINRRVQGIMSELSTNPNCQAKSFIHYCDFSETGGYNTMKQLLDNDVRPTAIICMSDQIAIGTLYALQEHSILIPEDCELISFDNLPLSQYTQPPLTSVSVPVRDMAYYASKLLLNNIVTTSLRLPSHTFEMPIIHRGTTRVIK